MKKTIEDKIITSDLPLQFFTPIAIGLFHGYYNVQYVPSPEYFDLRNKGFVLLPRHHSNLDIPLENIFVKQTMNKYPYQFMKASLGGQWFWKMLKGYPMLRLKDLENRPNKFSRRDIKKISEYVYTNRIPRLLKLGQVVIMHPQGERENGVGVKINNSIVYSLLHSQSVMGKQIPFVALNISYENQGVFRSQVTLAASRPAYFGNDDAEGLKNYILSAYK